MMGEFGEPWKMEDTIEVLGIRAANDCFIAGWCGNSDEVCPSDSEMIRICACINFLAGVPTEDLEVLMKNKEGLDHIRWEIGVFATNARGDGKQPLPPHPHW